MQDLLGQLFYYLDALWRRRWTALGVAFLVACLGWSATATLPDNYESSAKIYVDTASVLGPLLKGVAVENDMQKQIEVMRQTLLARPNLEEIARRTDMDLKADNAVEFEEVVDSLEERIQISADRTDVFTLKYVDTKPRRAYDVVQMLTTMFVQNNLGQSREDMQSAQTFLNRQIREYEKQLDSIESELADFKQKHRTLLPGQSGLQGKLEEAQTELERLQTELSNAVTRRDILKRELDSTPKMLVQQSAAFGAGPPTYIESQIMETRARLESLRSRYTDLHPDVVAAKRQLDSLRKDLMATQQLGGPGAGPPSGDAAAPEDGSGNPGTAAEAVDGPEGGIRIPNPTYSELRLAYVERQSEVEALRKQIARQNSEIEEIEARLKQVPEVEARLQKLKRDYDVIKSRYETLLERREAAKISVDREQQQNKVEFRIIEPPQVPVAPVGPNRPLFMAAALVASLGAGAGTTWLMALMTVTYGSVQHLRRDFDLRIIGVVSELPKPDRTLRAVLEGIGMVLAVAGFLGLFLLLVLIERQVGLPVLLEEPVTLHKVWNAVGAALQGLSASSEL